MRKRKRDHPLLDLAPDHLRDDSAAELSRLEESGEVTRAEIDAELRYLNLMSARKVRLPDDAYFAGVRQRIQARVAIKPVSFGKRVEALLLPEWLKPTPALLSLAAVLLIAIVTVFTYHARVGKMETTVAYGPYTSIGEGYSEQVSKLEVAPLSPEELQRYREILTMSIGILGSPSSLSRTRALLGSGRRL
jgi:hypothetical protein